MVPAEVLSFSVDVDNAVVIAIAASVLLDGQSRYAEDGRGASGHNLHQRATARIVIGVINNDRVICAGRAIGTGAGCLAGDR